jgi:adenosylmethionine-8-amino-7-oxononanoate aminotransferase
MPEPSWYERGLPHVWYPYAQMKRLPPPLKVVSASGSYLVLEDGRRLVDGVASWWSACHGHAHPYILEKMREQLGRLPHVMFAGTAHEGAYVLAERLASTSGLPRVFFTDSGSTAVETAMKMAVQYWRNKGSFLKNKFVCFHHGYHGDTMGGMSLCDPDRGMHKYLNGYMPRQYAVPLPAGEYDFIELDGVLADISRETAALVMEPLAQGAGGMKFHGADVVAEIGRLCRKHEILFIADEVMTGFYRLGSAFACEEARVVPDIMCVGKALTGGVMTMAAALAGEHVYEAFLGDDKERAFMSGPTYMANPLACSAANATLDLFERQDTPAMVAAIERRLHEGLSSLEEETGIVRDVRVKGAIGVVECDMAWEDVVFLRRKAPEYGAFLRPFADVIYVAPPLSVSSGELDLLIEALRGLVRELAGRRKRG